MFNLIMLGAVLVNENDVASQAYDKAKGLWDCANIF